MKAEEMQDHFDIARFGIEVEEFLLTPIGMYLMNRAQAECNKAVNEMKTVDVFDSAAVRKVQDDLNIPDKIVRWLNEAIGGGMAAHDAIIESEAMQGE